MNCANDGILRAKLDGELNAEELPEIDEHLASCTACRLRLETISHDAERVHAALAPLAQGTDDSLGDASLAWARFQAQERAEPTWASRLGRLFSLGWRPAWAGAALLMVLVASFSFAPARSWAQRLLAMLRVQKIAVVPVDTQALEGMQVSNQASRMIDQFISDNIVVTMRSDQPQTAADAAQASQLAGMPVRLLGNRTDAPKISVQGEQAFQMTLSRDRLQSILDEFGRNDLQLPSSIDGALIAVHIPKSVMATYGPCPQPKKDDSAKPPKLSEFAGCAFLVEVPSPTVSVPPELNIQELATLALQATGMSAQDAQAFCQNVDWTSTLVVPIPRDAASYETAQVDGVEGTLITTRGYARGLPGYSLLWVKNGIIYSLTGFGSADQAVPLADSLE